MISITFEIDAISTTTANEKITFFKVWNFKYVHVSHPRFYAPFLSIFLKTLFHGHANSIFALKRDKSRIRLQQQRSSFTIQNIIEMKQEGKISMKISHL